MQSPFKIFRKHQKIMLAALTLMAMIGFGIGDTVIKMVRTRASAQAAKIAVETNIGNITQQQMSVMAYHRRTIHRFIADAVVASQPEFGRLVDFFVRRYGFGPASPPDLVVAWLHRHEARQMGIAVSDTEVENYIKEFTNKKLSQKKFFEIIERMQLGPGELYDMFRDELLAVRAFQIKSPAALESPEKYWEYFQQLNTRQKIEAASIPVVDFIGRVPEPTEAEIVALFKEHKEDIDSAADGEYKPGFRQPQKVKLHYLVLSYTDAEKKALAQGEITDKEIEAYYEANKDVQLRFQDRSTKSGDGEFIPDSVKLPEDPSPEDASDAKPEARPDGPPDGKPQKPESDKPSSSSRRAGSVNNPPVASDCGPALGTAPDDTPAANKDSDNEKDAGKAEDKKDKTEPAAAKAAEPAETAPAAPEAPEDESDDAVGKDETKDTKSATGADKKKKDQPPPPKIKYKPLDAALRDDIRESLLRERTMKVLQEEARTVREAIFNVGLKFSDEFKLTDPDPQELEKLIRRSAEELQKIADSSGARFGETGLVSPVELEALPDIGKALAREPGSRESMPGQSPTIVQEAFTSEQLCKVFEVENPGSDIILCWKVQNSASHIPTLDEPGIREQVVAAKKRIEALAVAKKRAEELADKARQSGKDDLAAALGGETVTGDPVSGEAGGKSVFVAESPEFSFYRESAAPMSFRGPQFSVTLGEPIVVNNPGRKFMKYVFEELNEKEIGSAINDDATVYYVVKVVSRRPADREAFKDAPLFSGQSPYAQLAAEDRQALMAEFHRQLREKYAIKWHDVSGRDMPPMQYDEE